MTFRSSLRRSTLALSCCAALASLTLVAAAVAQTSPPRSGSVTFSKAVQLPGVTLAAGTYTFEHVRAQGADGAVDVWLMQPRKLVNRFHTVPIARAAAGEAVTFRPTASKITPAIDSWYFDQGTSGYQFLYSAKELRALTAD